MIEFLKIDFDRLIKGQMDPYDFNINGMKLLSRYEEIPLEEIRDMILFNKVTGKYFEEGSGFTFKELLNMLDIHNAFIHLAGGLSFGITDMKISQIRITKRYMQPFTLISKKEIESFNGIAEKELIEDMSLGIDYCVESLVSVYKNSRLYFFFEPGQLMLKEIRIGKVNEEYYTEK